MVIIVIIVIITVVVIIIIVVVIVQGCTGMQRNKANCRKAVWPAVMITIVNIITQG